jgi:hypothetical protein
VGAKLVGLENPQGRSPLRYAAAQGASPPAHFRPEAAESLKPPRAQLVTDTGRKNCKTAEERQTARHAGAAVDDRRRDAAPGVNSSALGFTSPSAADRIDAVLRGVEQTAARYADSHRLNHAKQQKTLLSAQVGPSRGFVSIGDGGFVCSKGRGLRAGGFVRTKRAGGASIPGGIEARRGAVKHSCRLQCPGGVLRYQQQ